MKKTIMKEMHYIACENGNEGIVNYLIEHGVDINIKYSDDETALHIACKNGMKILLTP